MSEVAALEHQLDNAKELMRLRDVAMKLSNNREFKELILDRFCVKECARYAQLSADPGLSENDRANSLALAQAAGHLRPFLSVTVQMGNSAAGQIQDLEEAIIEARQEEGV
jgi:hypothetical protein